MEKTFKDSQGHTLRYRTWGNLQHPAILFFHGFPGSNIQGSALKGELAKHQRCVIAVDRPGYGGSSPLKPLDTEAHVTGLLELLRFHEKKDFSIVGVSGGAPMAHIMASRYSGNVQSLNIICGLATQNSTTWNAFSKFQKQALGLRKIIPDFLIRPVVNRALKKMGPHKRIQHFLTILNSSDREILSKAENYNLLINSMTEAIRQGSQGILWDSALYNQDWLETFCDKKALSKIPVSYYHGDQDLILHYKMAQHMHQFLPHSHLAIIEGEGHYSLPLTKSPEIMSKLT